MNSLAKSSEKTFNTINDYAETFEALSVKTRASEILNIFMTTTSLLCVDLAGISLAILAGFMIRIHILPLFSASFTSSIPPRIWGNFWWVIIIWVFCLLYEGLYVRRMSFWRESQRIVRATALAFLFTLAIIALAKLGGEFSRTTLVLAYILALILLPLGRYIGKNLLAKVDLWNKPVLILGAGQTGIMIARSLINEPYIGYKVYGFLEDDPTKKKKRGIIINGVAYRILGGFNDAIKVISDNKIKNVILAAPGIPGRELVQLTNKLKAYTHSVLVVPDLIGMSVAGGHIEYLSNDQIIAYRTHNNLANPVNLIMKSLFDCIMGTLIFVLILPLIAILFLIVRIDSPGPVIYSGNRIGRKGKEFKCYKFRTMHLNNDEVLETYLNNNPQARAEWKKYAKLRGDDPRVTRAGKWMRKFSLDELPQIFNVINGEMSLVGARPYLPREKEQMGNDVDTILAAKPGITGLWQVSGRSEIDFQGRVKLETWYVRNWSMWLDITLLFRTVGVVLGRKGAY